MADQSSNIPEQDSNHANITKYFTADSIRLMVEAAEIGQLTDEAAIYVSNLVARKLRSIVVEAEKFCFHLRRKKMLTKDVDYALKVMNIPPILGFYSNEIIPFRFAAGGGRELFFPDDKEIELADVIARVNLPKLPHPIAIKSHWLAIDGVQPAIPENPPPINKDQLRLECVDPLKSLRDPEAKSDYHPILKKGMECSTSKKSILQGKGIKRHVEVVRIKQLSTHELSVEQQLYYKEITEACVGSVEHKRCQALHSLSHDPGLHQMLPRLCTFISEGVKINVVHNNLALLIYLMRMVKSLLENHTLYLEKYLHELLPTVITCIVSKQICNRPEQDNHYALRDFASKSLATICKNYNSFTNSLQTRVTRLMCKALDDPNLPLSSMYGALACLCELGPEVQRGLILRRLKMIGERLRPAFEQEEKPLKNSTEVHIKNLLLLPKYLPSTLIEYRPPPDMKENYILDYGFFGPELYSTVMDMRHQC